MIRSAIRSLTRQLMPAPLLSLALALAWLMLAGSLSSGQLLLAAALALVIPWFTERLRTERPRLARPVVALRLALVVLRDIVVANVEVARRVLGPEAAIRPRFVEVPLAISDAHGIAALACIITLTPGTLSATLSDDRRTLRVHALHVADDAAEAALVADIRARYEAPLLAIFGR